MCGGALQIEYHIRSRFALAQRLQIDLNAAAVEGGVRAVDADERGQTIDRRILQNHRCELLL